MTGYADPPKEFRFRPGQSGNPGGRPKGRHSFMSDLAAVVSESVQTDAGPVTAQRAVLQLIRNQALRGDLNAIKILVALITSELKDDRDASIELTPQQVELLQDFEQRQDLTEANPEAEGDQSGDPRPADSPNDSDIDGEKPDGC